METLINKTKCAYVIILGAVLSFFILVPGAAARDEFSIIVNTASEISGEKICLKDISSIKAPSFLKKEIGDIVIGVSPGPGEIAVILKNRIIAKIETSRLTDENSTIRVPEKVYVKRLAQRLSPDYIKEHFLKYAASFGENNRFELRNFKIKGLEPYPEGKLTLLFDHDSRFTGRGRFSLGVDVMVNGLSVDRLLISGRIDLFERIVCARVPLERGHKIEQEDLYYRNVNTSRFRVAYAKKTEDVAGKIPKNRIKKGELIKIKVLKQAPLVRRGDRVRLVAKGKGLKIITAGISKENGAADDLVRVENLSSGKVVRGVVTGRSMVEVYY